MSSLLTPLHYGDAELTLYGGSDGYRSRTATYTKTLELSVGQLVIHIFRVVSGDIDEQRMPFHQLFY